MHLNPFTEHEAALNDAMNSAFGECFTHIPMIRKVNRPASVDTDRDCTTYPGVWYEKAARSDVDKDPSINKKSNMSSHSVATSQMYVQISSCETSGEILQLDRLRREANQLIYEITRVAPNGNNTINYYLSEIEGPYGNLDQ